MVDDGELNSSGAEEYFTEDREGREDEDKPDANACRLICEQALSTRHSSLVTNF